MGVREWGVIFFLANLAFLGPRECEILIQREIMRRMVSFLFKSDPFGKNNFGAYQTSNLNGYIFSDPSRPGSAKSELSVK